MEVLIGRHALLRARKRGTTEAEIVEVVNSGNPEHADLGRLARSKVFPYRSEWQGRYYEHKKVKVIYVVEGGRALTITTISYYGTWSAGV